MTFYLNIENLQAEFVKQKFNFQFKSGKIYLITGKNGAGKSTFAQILAGNPEYKIQSGKIFLSKDNNYQLQNTKLIKNNNQDEIKNFWLGNSQFLDITKLSIPEKFLAEIMVLFQNPTEIPGVIFAEFIKSAIKQKELFYNLPKTSITEILKLLKTTLEKVELESNFYQREVNFGLSGGEKKKTELAQMLILKPKIVILDEIDSGLDSSSKENFRKILKDYSNSENILIIISHNPDFTEGLEIEKIQID
jgi:Fe-S cluster assembly ATP-binding protein